MLLSIPSLRPLEPRIWHFPPRCRLRILSPGDEQEEQRPRGGVGEHGAGTRRPHPAGAGSKECGLVVEKGDLRRDTWVLFAARGGERGFGERSTSKARGRAGLRSSRPRLRERRGALGCDSIL